jgi:GWxTD domain-containing protein
MKKLIGATLLSILAILALTTRVVSAIPKKDAWYTQHYIIMQDFERKAYRALSENGRKAFHELFWAARTTQARANYQIRMDYVMKNFWKENARQPWNTDRSRIYLLNGNPASIEVDQNVDWTMVPGGQVAQATGRSNEDLGANRAELWIYSFGQNLIRYIFVFAPPYQWKNASTGNRYLGELEDYNKNVVFGITNLERYKQDLEGLEKKK